MSTAAYAHSPGGMNCPSYKSPVGFWARSSDCIGGFDFVINSDEPPLLQMRMRLVTVVPALTRPKSMTKFESHPFSLVETAMEPIAAVVALPVIST
jgi:hypothetical protein